MCPHLPLPLHGKIFIRGTWMTLCHTISCTNFLELRFSNFFAKFWNLQFGVSRSMCHSIPLPVPLHSALHHWCVAELQQSFPYQSPNLISFIVIELRSFLFFTSRDEAKECSLSDWEGSVPQTKVSGFWESQDVERKVKGPKTCSKCVQRSVQIDISRDQHFLTGILNRKMFNGHSWPFEGPIDIL